jgi:uncharacterized membrane protein YcaP (DUF421 family)
VIRKNPHHQQAHLNFLSGRISAPRHEKGKNPIQEIHSAARQNSLSTLDGIDMIIFETTGELAIIKKISDCGHSTFEDVEIKLREE